MRILVTDIREGDIIRLTQGGPPHRVYRDYTRSRNAVDRLVVDGVRVATLPADQEVELVARHSNRRPVSLTKAWYLGSISVGSVVTYRHAPAGTVFRVVDIVHGPTARYHLAPYRDGYVAYTDATVGDLRLVRSHAVEAIRAARIAPDKPEPVDAQAALFEAGDAA